VPPTERQGADTEATNEGDLFDVAVDDELSTSTSKTSRKDRVGPNKRLKKDAKFGFGGKKRFSKSGDAVSSGDLRGFSSKKMKGAGGGASGGAKQRPGKGRRAASSARR
jgi:rRNA-processing protein EBP2